jgi:hypothetical protein
MEYSSDILWILWNIHGISKDVLPFAMRDYGKVFLTSKVKHQPSAIASDPFKQMSLYMLGKR